MNNDLEQFSEERLIELIHESSKPEIEALARIALAAKQSKPVAQVYQPANIGICAALGPAIRMINVGLPAGTLLYTTPQPAHTEQDGWIKCSERMPEIEEDYYQTFSSAGVDVSYFFEGYFADQNITHWMPLPASPKPEIE